MKPQKSNYHWLKLCYFFLYRKTSKLNPDFLKIRQETLQM